MTDRLWAPWRMEYVLSKKGGACVLCAHAAAPPRAGGHVLASLPEAFVVLNRYPFAAGHLLVVPRRHEASLEGLSGVEHDALFRLTREAVVRLRRAISAQGVNVGLNLGGAAGAGIDDHLHVHVVPRWQGDTNFMPVLADVRVMPQHLTETYEHLRPFFADLDVEPSGEPEPRP